jgi:hypothetical protein
MITVEDLIVQLAFTFGRSVNAFDYKIVQSFADQIATGQALTEKQGNLSVKILKRYKKVLESHYSTPIGNFLDNPIYKYPFRVVKDIKKMTIVERDEYHGKLIKVEFPYNQTYIDKIRENRNPLALAVWDKNERCWFFSLCEKNLKFLMDFAEAEQFETSEEFQIYVKQINNVLENMEQHVPMLILDDGRPKLKNIELSLKTLDILESIFEARKYGILTWDENISNFIKNYPNKIIRDFLNSNNLNFFIDSEKNDIFDLEMIIKYLSPCLFIIPGGRELEKTQLVHNFLNKIGIENESMSVMFRLPTETGKDFNNFVKNYGLNSPISEKTQIVFISVKVPKPLIKSNIYFNSVINLGFDNAHYSIKNFSENHQNLIYFSEKSGFGGAQFCLPLES